MFIRAVVVTCFFLAHNLQSFFACFVLPRPVNALTLCTVLYNRDSLKTGRSIQSPVSFVSAPLKYVMIEQYCLFWCNMPPPCLRVVVALLNPADWDRGPICLSIAVWRMSMEPTPSARALQFDLRPSGPGECRRSFWETKEVKLIVVNRTRANEVR